jgi:calcineurin-like phosphoesterase
VLFRSEVLEQGVAYIADVGDCPETWETIDIRQEDIVSVFEEIERPIRTA